MLKDFRRKVMQIANRLVKQGYFRSNAMITAWKLIKSRALRTKVSGTTFENRQNVLRLTASYNPDEVHVELKRERENAFDSNAVAVIVSVKDKFRAVIGYLPRAVASVVSVLMDKGLQISSDGLQICGGFGEFGNFGAKIMVKI